MRLRLIRHATVLLSTGGKTLLVDPMLDPAGARPPVENTPNQRDNPLVELPEPAEVVVQGLDAMLVTHLHQDHFDATATACSRRTCRCSAHPAMPRPCAVTGSPTSARSTTASTGTGRRSPGPRACTGRSARRPASSIGSLYVAGDTVWCDEVRAALDEHRPEVIVVNASGARFLEGGPLVMTVDDVVAVARHAPDVHVVAVHLEAINHCLETRADLHQRLHDEGLTGHVTVPENGAMVPLP